MTISTATASSRPGDPRPDAPPEIIAEFNDSSFSPVPSRVAETMLLDEVVTACRCRLLTAACYSDVPQTPLSSYDLQTFCNAALYDLDNRLAPLALKSGLSLRQYSSDLYSSDVSVDCHLFLVVEFGQSGNRYLLDPTFIQFFDPQMRPFKHCKGWNAERAGFLPIASELLLKGFIEVSDDVVRMHALALSTPKHEAMALTAEVLQTPSTMHVDPEHSSHLTTTLAMLAPEETVASGREGISAAVRRALLFSGISPLGSESNL